MKPTKQMRFYHVRYLMAECESSHNCINVQEMYLIVLKRFMMVINDEERRIDTKRFIPSPPFVCRNWNMARQRPTEPISRSSTGNISWRNFWLKLSPTSSISKICPDPKSWVCWRKSWFYPIVKLWGPVSPISNLFRFLLILPSMWMESFPESESVFIRDERPVSRSRNSLDL